MKLRRGFDAGHLLCLLQRSLSLEDEIWRPRTFTADKESDFTPESRNHIVRWLAHLNKKFKFLPETHILSVDIFDRLLQVVKVRAKHLKVIGVTCIYLAAKTLQEDETIPATLDVVRESQCGCSVAEVHRMELLILGKLGWDLRAPSSLEFMQLFHTVLLSHSPDLLHGFVQMTPARQFTVLQQKLQFALFDHGLMVFSPSTLALALLSLELELFHTDWFRYTVALETLGKVDNEKLMLCRERLQLFLSTVAHPKSIYLNASQTGRRKASTPPPKSGAKRKVKVIEEDEQDVYDAIKRLYNDEEMVSSTGTQVSVVTVSAATSTGNCASEMSQDRCSLGTTQHVVVVK